MERTEQRKSLTSNVQRFGASSTEPQWRRSVRAFFGTRLAPLGFVLVMFAIVMAASAYTIAPHDPNIGDFGNVLAPPSTEYLLGTDQNGRDVLSRLMHGSVISLQVGFGATVVSTVIGIVFGVFAAYYGGWIDEFLMRITDALIAFPSLILALAIATALGASVTNIILAIAVTSFAGMARLARGSALSVKEREFVEASRASGASDLRLIGRHILPNVISPIIVQFSLMVSFAILTEAGLSFLGVGVRPPQASWGGMLETGYRYLEVAPWISIVPGVAIFMTVLGFNLIGDGLRAAIDPRLRDIGTG
jgi:peptide/nickel transport system permease protein